MRSVDPLRLHRLAVPFIRVIYVWNVAGGDLLTIGDDSQLFSDMMRPSRDIRRRSRRVGLLGGLGRFLALYVEDSFHRSCDKAFASWFPFPGPKHSSIPTDAARHPRASVGLQPTSYASKQLSRWFNLDTFPLSNFLLTQAHLSYDVRLQRLQKQDGEPLL